MGFEPGTFRFLLQRLNPLGHSPHNCSLEEKLEFKRGEDILEKVEKFCYLGDMISCYDEASEAV